MKFAFNFNYKEAIINSFLIVLPKIIQTIDPISVVIDGGNVAIKTDEVDEELIYEFLMVYTNGFLKGIEFKMIKDFNDGQ